MYNAVFSPGRVFAVVGCVVTCVLASAAIAADPDLSAYYSFNEGSGEIAVDGSDYGNDGLIVGDPSWEAGVVGQAIVLQAQTFVDLNGPEFLNIPKTGITIAAWLNHNGTGDMSLFDAIGDAHGNGLYHVEVRAGGVRWFHRDDGEVQIFNINPGPVLPAQEWVHFTGTYEAGGDAVTYVDGEETHRAAGSGGELSDNWNLQAEIGQHKAGRWYDGMIDEFYMFSRALTEAEVQGVMNDDFLPVEPAGKAPLTWARLKRQ
ncbi:LamG domain-containing protein [Candidatus Poribacteria bacterium]|jgi:hypothetical protein|nr:LamG domain-containing protein [Candidatus Poribacteria bacterium]MBT5534551.1 LamG domain-containing protein [Candidatus Poribacteria bacterium]MBT7097266.1 LamG domain-containing protein [Candidatus Poribacteria bacterium]MBT7806532.1 LamG domain-containing protein [Candidatus Poribacteria bacterium]